MTIARVGYGFGHKLFPRLNGLRVWIGEEADKTKDQGPRTNAAHNYEHGYSHEDEHSNTHQHVHDPALEIGSRQGGSTSGTAPWSLVFGPWSSGREALVELRCNLDDATGELVAYTLEQLLAAGALDAWAAPLVMKKGRPAVQLACLARPDQVEALAALILRETPTLGVRWSPVERAAAARDWVQAATPWGPVRVKRKLIDGRVAGAAPEYEDCAAIARRHAIPLAQVYAAALDALEAAGAP